MIQSGGYDMYDRDKKVGRVDISILEGFQSLIYPGCPKNWDGKTVLEIDGFGIFSDDTDGGHGKGYGRFGLQKCYEMAQKEAEGRMVVHATWGAGSFYEHCGFIGLNKGKEGIKYFDPTSEALKKLYPEGRKTNIKFLLKEASLEDFQIDLDNVIIDKTSNENQGRISENSVGAHLQQGLQKSAEAGNRNPQNKNLKKRLTSEQQKVLKNKQKQY